jgi:hypothetical protein
MLLPPSLDELIPLTHPVRVVDEVLSKIDIKPFIRQYKTGVSKKLPPKRDYWHWHKICARKAG